MRTPRANFETRKYATEFSFNIMKTELYDKSHAHQRCKTRLTAIQ